MPGQGPAPAEKRRRRNEPARGDWVDLPPLEKPVIPPLPRRGKREGRWPASTRAMWEAWRKDPVTAQWSESDLAYAIDTIRLHVFMPNVANEVRLRMDALGLTPKGKRDLRWRIKLDAEVVELVPKKAQSARRGRLERVK